MAARGGKRRVLFLQGPSSPFMARVADEIESRGQEVRRINLSLGDRIVWRRPGGEAWRGRFEDWPDHIAGYLEREAISDLVLLGDARPYQSIAIGQAQRRNVRVHAVEHGYFRPDWLTVERDGLSSFSHMPRDPDKIRALAAGRPDPTFEPLAHASFARYAAWDVAYNLPNVVLGPITYPHYRGYALDHPLVEYAGVLRKMALQRGEDRHRRRVLADLAGFAGPLFLVPLQLATDFQIRTHSPFPHLTDAVRWIVRSFAGNADPKARLLFKVHPIDNGWAGWRRQIAREAEAAGVADRVAVIDGGDLDALVARATGLVTVNSTVGITAIRLGTPLIVLGNAVFDVPGLADQRPLAAFWRDPAPVDPILARDFLRALGWATQVRGGFTAPEAIAIGARNVAERVLEEGERLPRTAPQNRTAVAFRRRDEWLAERD